MTTHTKSHVTLSLPRPLLAVRRALAALVLSFCACTFVPAAAEELASCGKRPGDQLWVVSTRHLGCEGMTDALPDYRVHYHAQDAWHAADAATLLAYDDPAKPTIFYTHGNRYDATRAIDAGWEAYRAVVRCLPPDEHVRFVIWSWPSDKIPRKPLLDARAKTCRTLVESYYLSRLMTQVNPEVKTSVLTYSLGSRIAFGATHLAGGGELAGRVLPQPAPEGVNYSIVMIAGGVEDDGLLPGQRFEMAMSRTERVLNLYNPCDPALKWYRLVDKCEKPEAAGYQGIYGVSLLGSAAERIDERNVSGIVGKSHEEINYLRSETIMRDVRATVLEGKGR